MGWRHLGVWGCTPALCPGLQQRPRQGKQIQTPERPWRGQRQTQWARASQTVRDRGTCHEAWGLEGEEGTQEAPGPAAQLPPAFVLGSRAKPFTAPFRNVGHQRRFWRFLTVGRQSRNRGPLHQLKWGQSRRSGPSSSPRGKWQGQAGSPGGGKAQEPEQTLAHTGGDPQCHPPQPQNKEDASQAPRSPACAVLGPRRGHILSTASSDGATAPCFQNQPYDHCPSP